MKLTINGNIPEGKSFNICVNNQSHIIDEFDKSAVFEISDNSNCNINITETPDKNNHTFWKILLFIITSPIQAIFRLIFTQDIHWLKNVEPFVVNTSTFNVNSTNDTTVTFRYIKSKYNDITYTYSKPKIEVDNYTIENHYKNNEYSFLNCYFNFLKNLFSCLIILLAIFIAITVSTLPTNIIVSIICVSLSILFTAVSIVIAVLHYRKMKKNIEINKA